MSIDQEKTGNTHLENSMNERAIVAALNEQRDILMKIYEQTEKTKKYIRAGRIISLVYLILIVAPLVLAAIYLPPLLNTYLAPYQELLNMSDSGGETTNIQVDSQVLDQIMRQFGKQ